MKGQGLFRFAIVILLGHFRLAEGHGHLSDPPARSSMWREGYKTPRNYNDNQLNCGGHYNQWGLNNGKCGVCGDPYQNPQPRDNESGGRFGKGIVTRTYQAGQEVTFKVLITANHLGWFEFRLCPDGSPTTPVTQSCLDRYVLQMADGSGTRYDLGSRYNTVSVKVKLPAGVTCKQCVIQWRWHAGNNVGQDDQGNWCKGCGPQEEFYGCADVAITSSGQGPVNPNTPRPQVPITTAPQTTPRPFFTRPPVTYRPVTNAPITAAPQTTPRPFFTRPPVTYRPFTNAPITVSPIRTQSPFLTFPPVTFRPITNAPVYPPQTPGPVFPTFRPVFPSVTAKPTLPTRPTATTYNPFQPIRTQTPRPANGNLPGGFVPISVSPVAPGRPTSTPAATRAPVPNWYPFFRPPTTARPQVTFTFKPQTTPTPRPIATQPTQPVTFRPIVFTLVRQTTTSPTTTTPTTTTSTTTTPRPTTRQQTPRPTTAKPIVFTLRPRTTPKSTLPPTSKAPTAQRCFGINSWTGVPELDAYCNIQCQTPGVVCPAAFCACA